MKTRGQGLIEFALAMPILLLMTMGIIDFGRILIVYTMMSSSLRSGLRDAELKGYQQSVPYQDCDRMRDDIQFALFSGIGPLLSDGDIEITFVKADDSLFPNPVLYQCSELAGPSPTLVLESGDLVQIAVQTEMQLITPLVNRFIPTITLNFGGQRTVIIEIPLNPDGISDVDRDWLLDSWEVANFGSVETQNATDDTDNDGCNNGAEESRGTNPQLDDCDP